MTLFQLEVFLAVVQTGSFTRAGELLNASQSGVSHSIGDLEKELGIPLFTRNRKGVKLTDTGEQILSHVREIMNHTEQIHQAAAASRGMNSGTIRIGAFPSFSANVIPELFQAFRSHYPGVELLLFEGSYAEVEAWIKAGVVDLGFLADPSDGLDAVQLLSDPYVAILPANHPLREHDMISIEQLTHEPFLSLKSGCEHLVMRAFQKRGLSLNKQFEVAENSTILSMVEAGIGVSIVPSMILPAVPANVAVRPLHPPIIRNIGLAVLSQHMVSPAAAAFIKEAQMRFLEHT
ncbi:LysR family transcriptional regulator [Paenibacillus mucilaginosus]|uniref:LysR family transcriptional regulator n=1 Tax=Paenibacillus mucilaginosus TaxID=61624 RepID=UPI0005A08FE0|nr:LysR family transcriptional regulator [Paenibacillus mucilaginosus]MCG7218166.1 LysR family transcriptional regulator [Paenibacillus mucilaginosus]WDM29682.1 LysR family transcriptional regulator [Paenibacillus mucilaginosus]